MILIFDHFVKIYKFLPSLYCIIHMQKDTVLRVD